MKKIAVLLIVSFLFTFTSCGSSDADSVEEKKEATPPTELSDNQPPIDSDSASNPESDNSSKFLPLEITDYGYGVNNGYLYCSVILHNPNTDYCVDFPTFRITARDSDGILLGSQEQVLSTIYPKQDFGYSGLMFEVSEAPTSVDIELLPPDDYGIISADLAEHPEYIPLAPVNYIIRDDRLMGEVENKNDYQIDSSIVTIMFRNENGELIGGSSSFLDDIPASGTVPFDFSIMCEDLMTANYEVYANIW